MKTWKTLLVIVAVFLIAGWKSNVRALGLGFFLSGSSGIADFDLDYDNMDDLDDSDDMVTSGFGFVLDTNVAEDRVFNYRLNAGYERVRYRDFDFRFNRVFTDHTFGFAMVRRPFMRLWIGPCVRLSYENGDGDFEDFNDIVGFGIGVNVGANYHFGTIGSLSTDLGYRLTGYAGSFDSDYGYDRESGNYWSAEGEGFFRLSFLFRITDAY